MSETPLEKLIETLCDTSDLTDAEVREELAEQGIDLDAEMAKFRPKLDELMRARAVRLALVALKANPLNPDSPLPWRGFGRLVLDRSGNVVCRYIYADRDCTPGIAAAVNAAPILAAEVERLLPHADECAALADLHILCADAGIAPGHIVERVRQLVDRLAAARVAVGKSRMFVECFVSPDGQRDELSTFKVDIPANGYPRQWACDAAHAMLAEIDSVLARRAVGLEG
jgi:hypothetical protein